MPGAVEVRSHSHIAALGIRHHLAEEILRWFLDSALGIEGPRWLSWTKCAMPALATLGAWPSMRLNMVIFQAGFLEMPQEMHEAARMDGAGKSAEIRYVTLPLLTPTIFFVPIRSVIGSFQAWEATYLLTQGGPAQATLTVSHYIYQTGFQWFHMGYATALAWVLFAIVSIISVLQFRLQRRWLF